MSDWTVLCDFDGTVTVEDTVDTLLESFGRAGWQALESEWRAGRISSHDCMAGQVALLDMDRAQLDAHLAQRAIDPGFPEFIRCVHGMGIHVEILSDGLDYAIRTILARNGLDWLPVTSNRLQPVAARKWRLEFPNASASCRVASGTCKCARAEHAQTRRQQSLLIGDGASDFCVAQAADFVFAKGKLVAHCVAESIPHVAIENFADALKLLPDIVSGTLVAVPRAAEKLRGAASA